MKAFLLNLKKIGLKPEDEYYILPPSEERGKLKSAKY